MTGRRRVTLVLEDVARSRDGWPVAPLAIRLRRVLKALLRQYDLKAVDVSESPPAETPEMDGGRVDV
jgi:hypothetical protein